MRRYFGLLSTPSLQQNGGLPEKQIVEAVESAGRELLGRWPAVD